MNTKESQAHTRLDEIMAEFAPLEGPIHVSIPREKGNSAAEAIKPLNGSGGIKVTLGGVGSWSKKVRVESPHTLIAISWSRNQATREDNGWQLDSDTWPGKSTWPGRRWRQILDGFWTQRPSQAGAPSNAKELAQRVCDYKRSSAVFFNPLVSDEQYADAQAWMKSMNQAAEAVWRAQPWSSKEDLDKVLRGALSRVWPVAARR